MKTAKFIKEEGLLYIQNDGVVSYEETKTLFSTVFIDSNLPRHLRVLDNAQNAIFDFNLEGIPDILATFRIHLNEYENIRHAIVHLDPVKKAYTELLQRDFQFENYQVAIFPTESSARQWLFSNSDEEENQSSSTSGDIE